MEEFEKLLYEISEEVAKKDNKMIENIRPWNKMFSYILYGIVLILLEMMMISCGISINIYVLSLVGSGLMIKGLGMCRNKTIYFNIAHIIGIAFFIYISVVITIKISDIKTPLVDKLTSDIKNHLIICSVVICIIIYLFSKVIVDTMARFEGRLCGKYSRTNCDIEEHKDENVAQIRVLFNDIRWGMVKICLILVIIFNINRHKVYLISVIILILILSAKVGSNILKIRDNLIYYGYSIEPHDRKHMVRDNVLIVVDILVMVTIMIVFTIIGNNEKHDTIQKQINFIEPYNRWEQYNYEKGSESKEMPADKQKDINVVKEKLTEMGMEKSIVDDLLPADIMRLENTKYIYKSKAEGVLSFSGKRYKITLYACELFNNNENYNSTNEIIGCMYELLWYIEWIDSPPEETIEYESAVTIGRYIYSGVDSNVWVHMADIDGSTKCYESYEENIICWGSSIGTQSKSVIPVNGENYRSYGIYRVFTFDMTVNIYLDVMDNAFEYENLYNSDFCRNGFGMVRGLNKNDYKNVSDTDLYDDGYDETKKINNALISYKSE